MRKIALVLLLAFGTITAYSQETSADSTSTSPNESGSESTFSIQKAIDACIAMRDAAAANDTAAIKQSVSDLKATGAAPFATLTCNDDTITSLDGHLVFDESYADIPPRRGQTANGTILTKTSFVKAGKSTKWTFASKGHQELAVVAEAGGLVTMKVHVTNTEGLDKRFDDTRNVKTGLPQRKTTFELPKNLRNMVEVEIINCGNKDCSFVIISN